MAVHTRYRYDGLDDVLVIIESQEFRDEEPIGLPHRRTFANLPESRAALAEHVPAELLEEILEVWGDTPLEALPGAEIADDAAPGMEEQLAALKAENNLLRAQMAAAGDRQDFLEDCIAEMAAQVYAG